MRLSVTDRAQPGPPAGGAVAAPCTQAGRGDQRPASTTGRAASSSWRAIGTATWLPVCSPALGAASTITAKASAGGLPSGPAKPTTQALELAPSGVISAVPVLAPTVQPGVARPLAVPCSTTFTIAARIVSAAGGAIAVRHGPGATVWITAPSR